MAGELPQGDPAPVTGLISETEARGYIGRTFHAYLHIPFCTVRCGYCDFNTYTSSELRGVTRSDYVKHLISEIVFSREVLDLSGIKSRQFETVFFGGGTPTLLPTEDLASILASLASNFGIQKNAEITIEANPETVTLPQLEQLRAAGFNRVSVGMQSAVPEVLKVLDRTHDPANVNKSISLAKQLGFQTSVDLIFGAPGETVEQWRRSVESAIDLEPDHISAYSLIIEPGTKLARQIAQGELAGPDEDLQAEKYELADELFSQAGFNWYEISNWSTSEQTQSKHNLSYWRGQDWWGYGPGAHSHLGSIRWWNKKHPASYAASLGQFESPAQGREFLSDETNSLERILLESRLATGMSISEIKTLSSRSEETIAGLIAQELIDGPKAIAGHLVLTRKGRLLADAVVRDLTN